MTGKRLCISSQGYFGVVPLRMPERAIKSGHFQGHQSLSSKTIRDSRYFKRGGWYMNLWGLATIHAIMNGELEQMGLQPVVVNLI